MTDNDRPQDVGRSHARRGAPSPETTALLADYQAAMRTELRAVLTELEGQRQPAGLLPDTEPPMIRPTLPDRMRLWDLAIKIGRELGSAIDADPVPVETPITASGQGRSRKRVDMGGV